MPKAHGIGLGPPSRAPSCRRRRNDASPPGPGTRSTALPTVVLLHTAGMSTSTPRRTGGRTLLAAPVNEYIKALVIAEQQKIQLRKLEDLPSWPKAQELADLQARIDESTRRYEAGEYSAERYWPSLARMEAREAELKRERRRYEGRQQTRRHAIANLAEEWDKPDFTMEQKQAAIAETLTTVIIKPVGRNVKFQPDHIVPIFRESDTIA
jgi:site-specific DNA recombinase